MHAHHQHILIVGPVEDHDFPPPRRAQVGAPEEVVGGFELARLLEAKDPLPCGFMALNTWRTTPSLPPASSACRTTSSDWFPSAYSRYCSLAMRSMCFRSSGVAVSCDSCLSLNAGSILPSLTLALG